MRIFRFLLPLLGLLLLICLSILSALQVAFKRVAPLEGLGSKGFNMGITQDQPENLQSNMQTGLFRYKGCQGLAYKMIPIILSHWFSLSLPQSLPERAPVWSFHSATKSLLTATVEGYR